MSFTEQQLSEGIRTNHEFSDSERRLKRPRDERDSSQHGDHDKKPNPQVDALEHLSSGKVFFSPYPYLPLPHPSITTVVPKGLLPWPKGLSASVM